MNVRGLDFAQHLGQFGKGNVRVVAGRLAGAATTFRSVAGLTSTTPLANPYRNIWCSHWRILPAALSVPLASTVRTSSTSSAG